MARTCRFAFAGRSDTAGWSFDGSTLVVMPAAGAPLSFAVQEMAGIAGDGYTLRLAVPGAMGGTAGAGAAGAPGAVAGGGAPGADLVLSQLGADGPTLLEELRRTWLTARAKVLRLGGTGEGRMFFGQVAGLDGRVPGLGGAASGGAAAPEGAAAPAATGGAPEPFQALLFEDVLAVAREGRDVEPLFVALMGGVEFDEATYQLRIRHWPGQQVVFSKLAKQTQEFLDKLRADQALLATESAGTLATSAPSLPVGLRGALAGTWMPGRLMELQGMETVCPGFGRVFRQEWLPRLLRHEEGRYLLDWASSGSTWLGCTRASADVPDEESDSGEAGDGSGETAENAGAAPDAAAAENLPAPNDAAAQAAEEESPLWLLCGQGGVWFLEALSRVDRATYCFGGGDEVPALVSRLLCAPQFSREALYSPLGELVGKSADYAIAAQYLGFLVDLRGRFRGRVIHQTIDGWKKQIAKLGSGGSR